MITLQDITQLKQAALLAGFSVSDENIELTIWGSGIEDHTPEKLPIDCGAVYIFKYDNEYLKVGKANYKSNARYQSHHYNYDSSNSNLSKSIINDEIGSTNNLDTDTVGSWIKENTSRFNIIIPKELGKAFVNFAEAFFILKCNPKFEG